MSDQTDCASNREPFHRTLLVEHTTAIPSLSAQSYLPEEHGPTVSLKASEAWVAFRIFLSQSLIASVANGVKQRKTPWWVRMSDSLYLLAANGGPAQEAEAA